MKSKILIIFIILITLTILFMSGYYFYYQNNKPVTKSDHKKQEPVLKVEDYVNYELSNKYIACQSEPIKETIVLPNISYKGTEIDRLNNKIQSDFKTYIDYANKTNEENNKINSNIKLNRIQDTKEFVNGRAFFATVEKHDSDMYTGLFGRSLKRRAEKDALKLTKEAQENLHDLDLQKRAKDAIERSKNMKIHQLSFETQGSIKVPTTKNAARIMGDLMKEDSAFRSDAVKSLENARKSMPRPQQKSLLMRAERIIKKDPSKLTDNDKKTLYKGLNLTLTYHNDYDNNVQTKLYSKLKNKGYGALLDINDRSYSSYHANKPLIILDDGKVKLNNISEISDKKVSELYSKYNTERLAKDALYQATTSHIATASIAKEKAAVAAASQNAKKVDSDDLAKLFGGLSTNGQKGTPNNSKFNEAMDKAKEYTEQLLKRRRTA